MLSPGDLREKVLIGGRALVALGSSRQTSGTDYLVCAPGVTEAVLLRAGGERYLNANGHPFFAALWAVERGRQLASPQTVLELKAWLFAHCWRERNGRKLDEAEFDIKFLVRSFNLPGVLLVRPYLTADELGAVEQVIQSMRW